MQNNNDSFKPLIAIGLAAILTLAGCGGGGGGGSGASTGGGTGGAVTSISGTAATGAPIAGQVVVIDSTGKTFSATTTALGAYVVNVAGGTPPFILTVVGTSGGKTVSLSSIATAAGQTVNITPLTDLIVSTASGQPGGAALVNLCTPTVQAGCTAALTAATSGTNPKLSAAVTAVTNMIAPLNTAGTNPLNGTFTANGVAGTMDALLDQILVTPASAQGAMATVTLIAVPTQQLGTVTLPASPGGASTPTTVTPSAANLTAANAATTTLADINVCMATLAALYPANMTTPPTSAQLSPFFDSTFSLAGPAVAANTAKIISALTTLGSAGGAAVPGFTLMANGFAPYDFTPQATTSLLTTTPPVTSTTAWVNVSDGHNTGGLAIWKMVKGAAYTGCPSGWRVAGPQSIGMYTHSRIMNDTSLGITGRYLSFQTNAANAAAEGVVYAAAIFPTLPPTNIVVTGAGLSVYSGNPSAPVGSSTPVTLITAPPPVSPAVPEVFLGFAGQIGVTGSYYGNAEALESCQDLGAANFAPTGTPCFDETAITPDTIFTVTVTGTQTYSFPHIVGAVPLSLAFATANVTNLFPQNIVATPSSVAALNTAVAGYSTGAHLDSIISLTYTMPTAYGTYGDNCGITLFDSVTTSAISLSAEMSATGQQTSCTFVTSGLNSGSLQKPANPFSAGVGSFGRIRVGATALGNQIGTVQGYN